KIDNIVAKFFHDVYLWGGEIANNFMKIISWLAELGILFLLIGLGLSLFKRTRKIGATILLSVALGFIITNLILKPLISRARPFQNVGTDYYKWWLDAGMTKESGHSFPSGHTTATTAFAFALFLTTNKKYSWTVLLLPLLMASSRIYLMVHYFSDCVGGIIVGSACAIISWLIIKLIYKSKLKLFIWLREFNIFKSKQTVVSPSTNNVVAEDKTENKQVEEFVYIRQADESIQQDTKESSESTQSDNNGETNDK
ncbi:MAG: phosphatase PAP2 family protein, partial [Clostridia bacterium]|nr:phosphatase PAP2 family protein [Clostridia bacterium]